MLAGLETRVLFRASVMHFFSESKWRHLARYPFGRKYSPYFFNRVFNPLQEIMISVALSTAVF